MFDPVEQAIQPVEQQQEAPQQAQDKQDTSKEHNMRVMRERAESAERRAQDLERMMMQNSARDSQLQKVEQEVDDTPDISDDNYIEGKQLKKYVRSLRQELKSTKQQFEEERKQLALSTAEMRLKSQFEDFNTVVTKENLEKLARQKPSLYNSIIATKDVYDQGYSAYDMIKASGIANDNYESVDRRIEENRNKPKSASTLSASSGNDSALAKAANYDQGRRILTQADKDRLMRQVEEAKRNKR